MQWDGVHNGVRLFEIVPYEIDSSNADHIIFLVWHLSKHSNIIVISHYTRVISYYPTLADCYVFNVIVIATYHWPLKLTYIHIHRSQHRHDHDW